MIPNDPFMLLSYINTQLRDHYANLEDLADGLDVDVDEITAKLAAAGYVYSSEQNRFMIK